MKALKRNSVQVLIIGLVLCSAAFKLGVDTTLITIFASAFTILVTGDKVRDNLQANKGQYYDEESKKLKKVE